MKIRFEDASEKDLKSLLSVLVNYKFFPEEQAFYLGHPSFDAIVSAAKDAYIEQVGAERFESEFFRSEVTEYMIKALKMQVEALKKSNEELANEELLDRLTSPIILDPATKSEILGDG